jgi:uncharacterized protein YqeY
MTDDPAAQLRAALRTDLRTAMKARQKEAVSALRTALAALDDAEAVEGGDDTAGDGSVHVAGARAGVGATEAQRRTLSLEEVRAILRQQIAERDAEAARREVDRPDAAARLRGEAATLRPYLDS